MVEQVKKFIKFVGTINTTNFRIVVTVGMSVVTGILYYISGIIAQFNGHQNPWEPNESWLVFLAAMSGIDTLQFYAKRKTHDQSIRSIQNTAAEEETEDSEDSEASTDLEELRKSDKG